HHGQHGEALATAGFADDAERFALRDSDADLIDRAPGSVVAACGRRRKRDVEIFDLEQDHVGVSIQRFSLASRASRRPSPSRLKASTVTRIMTPGNVTTHQARDTNSRASASIVPHSGNGGCAPSPRNPSDAASRMAVDTPSVAWTISGAVQFGSTSLNIRRSVPAPETRAAVT